MKIEITYLVTINREVPDNWFRTTDEETANISKYEEIRDHENEYLAMINLNHFNQSNLKSIDMYSIADSQGKIIGEW